MLLQRRRYALFLHLASVMAIRSPKTNLLLLALPTPCLSLPKLLSHLSHPDNAGATSATGGEEDLVSVAVSVLREQRSRSRWNYLKSILPQSGLSAASASEVLLRLRTAPRLALRFFLWSRRLGVCVHDAASYAAGVHVLARGRLRSAALDLLRDAIRTLENPHQNLLAALATSYRAFDSAPVVFDLLIRAHLDAKKLDHALEIIRLLRSRGIHPQIATANSLIRSISRSRGCDASIEIYKELFHDDDHDDAKSSSKIRLRISPNVQTFNALLLACYRDQRPGLIAEIRSEMEGYGCDANVFTYSVLMAGLCDEGRVRDARALWEEMSGKQIAPDIMALNTLIGGYCDAGEVDRAEELHRDMVFREIKPTCATYELLIKGHCMVGDLEAALAVYKEMKRRGFGAEVRVLDKLVEGLCEKGRVEVGLGLLREEMRREGFVPSRKSYEVLIRGFCVTGKVEVAAKLQAEMAGKGMEAGVEVYEAFIEGYEKMGDMEKVERLKEEMVGAGMRGQ